MVRRRQIHTIQLQPVDMGLHVRRMATSSQQRRMAMNLRLPKAQYRPVNVLAPFNRPLIRHQRCIVSAIRLVVRQVIDYLVWALILIEFRPSGTNWRARRRRIRYFCFDILLMV